MKEERVPMMTPPIPGTRQRRIRAKASEVEAFEAQGYVRVEVEAPGEPETTPGVDKDGWVEKAFVAPAEWTPEGLAELTVAQLRDVAETAGLSVPSKAKKADLILAIVEQAGSEDADTADVDATDDASADAAGLAPGEEAGDGDPDVGDGEE